MASSARENSALGHVYYGKDSQRAPEVETLLLVGPRKVLFSNKTTQNVNE